MFTLFSRLAFKNLWRHRRRTLLTIASISCGCAVIMWLQSIIHGRNINMINVITSTYTGHVQIFQKEYLKSRLAGNYIRQGAFVRDVYPKIQDILWAPRLHLPTIISSGEDSVPIQLDGIQPSREALITSIHKNLISGEFLSDQEACVDKQIFVGSALAEALHVGLGDKLVALTQARDGTLGNDLYRVKGIFQSGSADFDKKMAFTHIACTQELSAIDGFHEVVLKPQNLEQADLAHENLAKELPGYAVTTWREAIPAVATMIRYNDASLKMIIFILFTVITLGLVNTILMNLFERTKEFGVLLSIGMTPHELKLLVFLETLFLGFLGILAGTIVGALVIGYHQWAGFDMSIFFGNRSGADGFSFDLIIRPVFTALPYLKVVGLELCFLIVAGIYPAWKVSQLNPVEVMRS